MTLEEYTRNDEERLRAATPSARVAVVSRGALSVGVGQKDDAVCIVRARQRDIPIVRRSSGGLGLWHAPGDLVWSLVLPRSDRRVGHDFSTAYSRLGTAAQQLLAQEGIPASWGRPAGLPGEYCLLSGRGAVLSVGGRALGGAAQHLTRHALLHHGVLPFRIDPAPLGELFDLSAETIARSLTDLERLRAGTSSAELARRLEALLRVEVGSTTL